MYCTNCGNKVDDSERFCTNCGKLVERSDQATTTSTAAYQPNAATVKTTAQGAPAQPASAAAQKRKPIDKGVAIGIAIAAIVVVAAIVIGVLIGRGTPPAQSDGANTTYVNSAEEATDVDNANGDKATTSSPEEAHKKTKKSAAYTLSTRSSAGKELEGKVKADKNGYVIADSDTHEYTTSELKKLNLNDAELCVAWNEPFARRGHTFGNKALQEYFEHCSWYKAKGPVSSIPDTAAKNAKKLKELLTDSSWTSLESQRN